MGKRGEPNFELLTNALFFGQFFELKRVQLNSVYRIPKFEKPNQTELLLKLNRTDWFRVQFGFAVCPNHCAPLAAPSPPLLLLLLLLSPLSLSLSSYSSSPSHPLSRAQPAPSPSTAAKVVAAVRHCTPTLSSRTPPPLRPFLFLLCSLSILLPVPLLLDPNPF